jgi:hypothetical protein
MTRRSSDRKQQQISFEPILLVIVVGVLLVVVIGAMAVMLYPKVSHMLHTAGS